MLMWYHFSIVSKVTFPLVWVTIAPEAHQAQVHPDLGSKKVALPH